MTEWLIALVMALVGWIISVEYRLGLVFGLTTKVERIESQVDKLVEHLIEKDDRPTSGSRHQSGDGSSGHAGAWAPDAGDSRLEDR